MHMVHHYSPSLHISDLSTKVLLWASHPALCMYVWTQLVGWLIQYFRLLRQQRGMLPMPFSFKIPPPLFVFIFVWNSWNVLEWHTTYSWVDLTWMASTRLETDFWHTSGLRHSVHTWFFPVGAYFLAKDIWRTGRIATGRNFEQQNVAHTCFHISR